MLTRIGDNITKKDKSFINGSMIDGDTAKPVLLEYGMQTLTNDNLIDDPFKQEDNIRILNDKSEFKIGEEYKIGEFASTLEVNQNNRIKKNKLDTVSLGKVLDTLKDKFNLDITDDKFEEFKVKTAELMKKDVKKM